ncbi:hypothetical protein PR048_003071 [Dryococelus australis]|uniref:Reverse transcriptase RNase H-like domain-containing protein n=1 Tax=Dryococelus australis TaxID=614101 RepID=A0ABQ9IM06_9NEOP|nr:hypothetical protein PR048_003071 [Dryococelus australis]
MPFSVIEVRYFGHLIGSSGISPDPKLIETVQLYTTLTTSPVLAYPYFSKPFVLATDASQFAIGSVLSQVVNDEEHPVANASRQLNKAEIHYSVTEKGPLAVVWSIKYFRCYLVGNEFTIGIYHAALKWMLGLKDPSGRLMHWSLQLSKYIYKIQHRPGRKQRNADCTSRRAHLSSLGLSRMKFYRNVMILSMLVSEVKKATNHKVAERHWWINCKQSVDHYVQNCFSSNRL